MNEHTRRMPGASGLAAALVAFAFVLAACGGGEGTRSAEETADAGKAPATAEQAEPGAGAETGGTEKGGAEEPGRLPEWMSVDRSGQTVELEIVAAKTSANNNWNYNGYAKGDATITVPEGYRVTIDFRNEDPAVAHSVGIDAFEEDWPATFRDPKPVFEGAISSNPTKMSRATMPGESETIEFVADQAGEYAMVCYIPGHAAAGMWIHFDVSAEGEAGFSSPSDGAS